MHPTEYSVFLVNAINDLFRDISAENRLQDFVDQGNGSKRSIGLRCRGGECYDQHFETSELINAQISYPCYCEELIDTNYSKFLYECSTWQILGAIKWDINALGNLNLHRLREHIFNRDIHLWLSV